MASFSNQAKNSSSFANGAKASSSFENQDKTSGGVFGDLPGEVTQDLDLSDTAPRVTPAIPMSDVTNLTPIDIGWENQTKH